MRFYTGNIFIVFDDNVVPVKSYIRNDKLKKESGYLLDEYVYIYHGKLREFNDDNNYSCGIYKVDDEYIFIHPRNSAEKEMFHRDRIVEFNIHKMYDEIEKDKGNFLTEEEIEIIQANTEIFTVAIKEDDDFLKKLIKEAINRKKINPKIYKDRFKNEHSFNNMKSALSKKSKMSVSYFLDWCEILGLDWNMCIWDNGDDKFSQLESAIIISSHGGLVNEGGKKEA